MNTIVIGIDSVPWNYIKPLMDAHELPVISELIKKGSYGTLKSTIPPLSPLAWSSFLTGMRPENHSIIDWWHVEEDVTSIRVKTSKDRTAPVVWNYLNAKGKKVGVINIPITSPVSELDGFIISSFDSSGALGERCWPSKLEKSIIKRFDDSILSFPSASIILQESQQAYERAYIKHERIRTALALHYSKEYNIDVLIINFSIIDHFNHHVDSMDAINRAIKAVDDCIGQFINDYPDANYLIISDHGAQRTEGGVLINNWLIDKGYLVFKSDFLNRIQLHNVLCKITAGKYKLRGLPEKIIRNMLFRLTLLFPQWFQTLLIKKLLHITGTIRCHCNFDGIDKDKSVIQFCSSPLLGLYINPQFPDNDTIREKLFKELSEIKDPFGEGALFKKVIKGEELYKGCSTSRIPDFVCMFHCSKSCMISYLQFAPDGSSSYAVKNRDIPYFGSHTEEGIYIFSGPEFRHNAGPNDDLRIYDIFSYILAINDISLPSNIDSKIKKEFLSYPEKISTASNVYLKDKFRIEKNYDKEEEEIIKKRLEELGYY